MIIDENTDIATLEVQTRSSSFKSEFGELLDKYGIKSHILLTQFVFNDDDGDNASCFVQSRHIDSDNPSAGITFLYQVYKYFKNLMKGVIDAR